MSGSTTGTVMQPDGDAAYESSVSKVEDVLEKFGQEHSIPEPPKRPADDSKPTPKPDEKDDSDLEQESESDNNQESADEDDPTPAKDGGSDDDSDSSKEKPAIPDNYFRAAAHQGWTPERISKLYDADPEGTVDFLKKIYEDSNSLNGEFAELGRKKRELEQAEIQAKAKPAGIEPEMDLTKLREQYEDSPFDAIVKVLEHFTKQKSQEQVSAQPVQSDSNWREEDAAIAQQLVTFFTSKDLEVYRDFYGSPNKDNPYDWSNSTPGQAANRQAVINEADAIIAGRKFQGRDISVAEALERAHLRVSAPITEQVVRERIVSQIKKRSKGITLRPSASRGVAASSKVGEKSVARAEEVAAEKLKEINRNL